MKLKQMKNWCIERLMSINLHTEYNKEVDEFINKLIEHRDELIFCEIEYSHLYFIFEGKIFSLRKDKSIASRSWFNYDYYLTSCNLRSLEKVLQDIRNNPHILEKVTVPHWLAINAYAGLEAYFYLRPSWETMKRFETLVEKPAIHAFSVFGIPTGEEEHSVSFECERDKSKFSNMLIKIGDKASRVDFIDSKFVHYFNDTPTELK